MNDTKERPILFIEDSDEDFTALARTISRAKIFNPVYRCEDGEEALDFLYQEGEYADKSLAPRPGLIILDLNLPGIDGQEVLATIKQERELQKIPIVIFSTSSNPKDIDACYSKGVSGYIVKPMNTERLNKLVQTFLAYWFQIVELPN